MIMEILDAFGIPTAGAPDCEADDVLGTLAGRERKDPVVVVSGDRDLLAAGARRPGAGPGALPRSRPGEGDEMGPGGGRRHLRRSARPGRARLRRVGAAARRSVRRAARRARRRREDGGHPAGPARLARGHPGRRARPEIEDVQGVSDEAAGGHRLHRGRRTGGAGGHRRRRQLLHDVRHAAAGRRAPAQGRQARRTVRRDVVDRPAAEGARRRCPAASSS